VLPLRRGNAQLSAHTHYIFLLEIIETGLSYHVNYVVNANNENKAKQIIAHRVHGKHKLPEHALRLHDHGQLQQLILYPKLENKNKQHLTISLPYSNNKTQNGAGNQPLTLILASKRLNIGAFLSMSGIIINLQHYKGRNPNREEKLVRRNSTTLRRETNRAF
jgi:hypothetical protein